MEILESDHFKRIRSKLDKDKINRINKILIKILEDPEIGKPMKFERKGTREVYISKFRLAYAYIKEEDKIILLDFYHKDER